jgi:hypothetical protein
MPHAVNDMAMVLVHKEHRMQQLSCPAVQLFCNSTYNATASIATAAIAAAAAAAGQCAFAANASAQSTSLHY